ncbi:MAG: hypothetical protein PVH29_01600 [Candidatus Zixiibacteriota bacterium]|jgi:hypothetical protein
MARLIKMFVLVAFLALWAGAAYADCGECSSCEGKDETYTCEACPHKDTCPCADGCQCGEECECGEKCACGKECACEAAEED